MDLCADTVVEPAQFAAVEAAAVRTQDAAEADLFQCFTDVRGAFPVQPFKDLAPGVLIVIAHFIDVIESIVFIGMQAHEEPFAADLFAGADVVQAADVVMEHDEVFRIRMEAEAFGKGGGGHDLGVTLLAGEGDGIFDKAFRVAVAVVVKHQGVVILTVVGVGEYVFIHVAVAVGEVIQDEIADFGKALALVQEREDLAFVAVQQALIYLFIPVGPFVFHAVLFRETFQLSVAEHRQAGHGGHQQADTEIFVAGTELFLGGLFVRVVHEVDIALQDLRVEFQSVFEHHAVAAVVFIAQQVHESGVVNAVHAQGADEVVFHHPEGLCQQQGVRGFRGDPVNNFAPEFFRESPVEFFLCQSVFSTAGDVAAAARFREPEALIGFLGQRHGGVKADDRRVAGDGQNGLDHRFTDFRVQIVQLGGVIPGHGSAVVAVIDVTGVAGAVVDALENDRGILTGEVMVFDADADVGIRGKIAAVESVGRVRTVGQGKEKIRAVEHPVGIDAHVVWDHVGRHADAVLPGAELQVLEGFFTAEVIGNAVISQGIGRCQCLRVPAPLLDGLGGFGAFPKADEPETGETFFGKGGEFFIRDLIQVTDLAAVFFGKLVQPDIGVFGHEHQTGHPFAVGAEVFIFTAVAQPVKGGQLHFAGTAETAILVFFAHEVQAHEQTAQEIAQNVGPVAANEVQLVEEGVRMPQCRLAQVVDEGETIDRRLGGGKIAELEDQLVVIAFFDQRGLIEELSGELHGGRVAVGDPEHQDLFDGVIAVFQAVGRCGVQIFRDGL